MASRRQPGQHRRAPRGGGTVPDVFYFNGATFTRSSTAYQRTSAATIQEVGVDVLRREDRGDGEGALPMLEGSFTQELTNPNTFESWVPISGATVVDNSIVGPTGEMNAAALTIPAASGDGIKETIAVADNAAGESSVWAKVATGTDTIRIGCQLKSGSNSLVTADLTTTWQRFSRNHGDFLTGGTPPKMLIINSEAVAKTVHIAYAQVVEADNVFPVSEIDTGGATKAADVLTMDPPPTWFTSGKWKMDVFPSFSSTDAEYGAVQRLFHFTTGDDSLYLDMGDNKVYARVGGSLVSSLAKTWARHEKISITMDIAGGNMNVTTATNGSEDIAITGAWPSEKVWIGSSNVGVVNRAWFGRMSEPERL